MPRVTRADRAAAVKQRGRKVVPKSSERRLSADQRATLVAMYGQLAPDGIAWTHDTLAAWAEARWGVPVSRELVRRAVDAAKKTTERLTVEALKDLASPRIEECFERERRVARHLEAIALDSDDPGKVASALKALTTMTDQAVRLAGLEVTRVDITSGGKPLTQLTDAELDAELRGILGAAQGAAREGAGAAEGEAEEG